MWDEWDGDDDAQENEDAEQDYYHRDFDIFSALSESKVNLYSRFFFLIQIRVYVPALYGNEYLYMYVFGLELCTQDYYRILEVDYDATEEAIRSNYIRLALVCLCFIDIPHSICVLSHSLVCG